MKYGAYFSAAKFADLKGHEGGDKMQDLHETARDLVERLSLQYEPVGVTLYTDADPLPPNMPFSGDDLKSYCQALILAGGGKTLLLKKEKMGCKL